MQCFNHKCQPIVLIGFYDYEINMQISNSNSTGRPISPSNCKVFMCRSHADQISVSCVMWTTDIFEVHGIKESIILHILTRYRLAYITWRQIGAQIHGVARIKTTRTKILEDNTAINWKTWLHTYELYATIPGVITKSEKVCNARCSFT